MKLKIVIVDFELSPAARRVARLALLGGVALLLGGAVPYTFSTGDILSSKAVNANFADVDARLASGRIVAMTDAGARYSTGFTTYCGKTAPVTGAFTSGAKVGYAAAKGQCESVCSPSAHMCTSEEIVRTSQMGYVSEAGWFSTGVSNAATASSPVNDCAGWRIADNTQQGSSWTGTGSEFVGWFGCNNAEPILCCD